MEKIELGKDQYLLKVATIPHESREDYKKIGFLTKLNKDGSIPVAFQEWRSRGLVTEPKVVTEEFAYGWKLLGYRRGASVDWAVLIHPRGFTVEVKLAGFIELIKTVETDCGVLIGAFKWSKDGLIEKL